MSEKGRHLYVVSAPSGAGKSTLTKAVSTRRPEFMMSISCTTRPRRGDEQHGREYYFLTQREFFDRRDRGDFLEWAQVHGHYYGSSREFVEQLLAQGKRVIFDIDVQGAQKLKEVYPECTLIFISPPSRMELERRLRERKTDDPAEIAKRLRNAAGELYQARHYDFIILNDVLENAVDELEAVITETQTETSFSQDDLERLLAEFDYDPPID